MDRDSAVTNSTIGYFGYRAVYLTAFVVKGSPELYAFDSVPYANKGIVIHSIDPSGAIVASIKGKRYLIKARQWWRLKEETDPTADCHVVTTYAFHNLGLVKKDS